MGVHNRTFKLFQIFTIKRVRDNQHVEGGFFEFELSLQNIDIT